MRIVTAVAMACGLSACAATSQPPVQVRGGDVDLMTVSGKWYGTYEGSQSGRKGSIHFELYKGTREAEGQVIMNADKPELATTLKINFIAVGGQKIQGKIGPYLDPGCNCKVETTFTGVVRGSQITGTFVTKAMKADLRQEGQWKVVRKGS